MATNMSHEDALETIRNYSEYTPALANEALGVIVENGNPGDLETVLDFMLAQRSHKAAVAAAALLARCTTAGELVGATVWLMSVEQIGSAQILVPIIESVVRKLDEFPDAREALQDSLDRLLLKFPGMRPVLEGKPLSGSNPVGMQYEDAWKILAGFLKHNERLVTGALNVVGVNGNPQDLGLVLPLLAERKTAQVAKVAASLIERSPVETFAYNAQAALEECLRIGSLELAEPIVGSIMLMLKTYPDAAEELKLVLSKTAVKFNSLIPALWGGKRAYPRDEE